MDCPCIGMVRAGEDGHPRQSLRHTPARPSVRPTATFFALRATRRGLPDATALMSLLSLAARYSCEVRERLRGIAQGSLPSAVDPNVLVRRIITGVPGVVAEHLVAIYATAPISSSRSASRLSRAASSGSSTRAFGRSPVVP